MWRGEDIWSFLPPFTFSCRKTKIMKPKLREFRVEGVLYLGFLPAGRSGEATGRCVEAPGWSP